MILTFLLQEVYAEDSYLSINGDPNQIRLDTIRIKSLGIKLSLIM